MARYRVTHPNGSIYEIEAPDTASETDVLNYAQQRLPGDDASQSSARFSRSFNHLPIPVRDESGGLKWMSREQLGIPYDLSNVPRSNDLGFDDRPWNSTTPNKLLMQIAAEPRLLRRDKEYLDKYYDAVLPYAKAYNVDPMSILGLGWESNYGTAGTYSRTGDAFGMTGGNTRNMTTASSPEENVRKLFDNYGDQIYNTGSDTNAFINGMLDRNANGTRVPGWKVYNSVNPNWGSAMRRNGIDQMNRSLPLYLRQKSAR